ncbi:MAG: spore germination protein [Halanaerobium sp.]|nr:spore germination protein [Halanaerobium sp.]
MNWLKLIRKLLPGQKKEKKTYDLEDLDINERVQFVKDKKINLELKKNIDLINTLFGNSYDLGMRRITVGAKKVEAAIFFMSGMSDPRSVEEILEALELNLLEETNTAHLKGEKLLQTILTRALNNKQTSTSEDLTTLLKSVIMGSTMVLLDGVGKAVLCDTRGMKTRGIQEPETEIVIRGPRDGFIENIQTNTSLLRHRIHIPDLWLQKYEIGSLSKTDVVLAYIKGLASEELIEEVKSRLEKIDIDMVLESGYIEEYILDETYTLFPLIKRTERPDIVVSCLVEGKVAILIDGTPFALILPTTFSMLMQAPDDYYEKYPIGSFIRILRYVAYMMALLLPGLYVAVINYHFELLPVDLLMRIAATREGVPFPVIVEALILEVLFEVLREAGIRLPKAIGSTISIVGALILGEAAINAGLTSPPMVIIVALTAIASFTVPDYPLGIAARILRFVFLFLGATLGLFGIQFGILLLLIHLCSLRSFGQPYFQPFGPFILADMKDSLVRRSWFQMINRPKLIGGRNPKRQDYGQNPRPPKPKGGKEKDEK